MKIELYFATYDQKIEFIYLYCFLKYILDIMSYYHHNNLYMIFKNIHLNNKKQRDVHAKWLREHMKKNDDFVNDFIHRLAEHVANGGAKTMMRAFSIAHRPTNHKFVSPQYPRASKKYDYIARLSAAAYASSLPRALKAAP